LIRRILRRLGRAWRTVREAAAARWRRARQRALERGLAGRGIRKLNLASGSQRVPGYFGIDLVDGADLRLDLARMDLPFPDSCVDTVVCMSAINYFTRARAQQLVREMHRVLRAGGVCRVGVQDMKSLAERYVRGDREFFFQKLADGRDRFEGPTLGDKFAAWFYGYAVGAHRCEYFYDYESLAYLFREAGFSVIERKAFRESRIAEVEQLDNRPDQMFFLEAVK
jgi:predicted SAM-dependent methyltransferase